jgi:hypothetical protein
VPATNANPIDINSSVIIRYTHRPHPVGRAQAAEIFAMARETVAPTAFRKNVAPANG